ncbi:MAG: hydroxyacylglutathione hydrolase [Gammaproteobacteria bacterium]
MSWDINVTPLPAFSDNYMWVLTNPQKQAIVVDPGEAPQVIDFLEKNYLPLVAIFLTHHHWDHTNGVDGLIKKFPDVVVFRQTSFKDSNSINIHNFPVFKIIAIPGHTLDHIAYYGHNKLFCGDTLFTGGCGRVFEGTPEQMYASLEKLRALPDDTNIYCGHEYTEKNLLFAQAVEPENTDLSLRLQIVKKLRAENKPTVPATLYIEKLTNPFLRCHLESVKIAAEKYAGKKLDTAVKVFEVMRDWKNRF